MDQKPIQETQRETALRLNGIIETATDGIITINERGVIELVNTAAATLFGYAPEEMVGQNVRILMNSPHRENHDGYMDRYARTGEARIIGIGRELEGRRKDGTMFPFRLSISEVQLNERKIFTGILHDITEQREAEKRIQELNAELENRVKARTEELADTINHLLKSKRNLEKEVKERKTIEIALLNSQAELEKALEKEKELNELKSRFVSIASHEFRTPLSTILSSAALMGHYTQSEQQEKRDRHIQKIKSSVENLTSILNDFLSLSKLEEGRIEVNIEPVDINAFCHKLVDEIESLCKNGQRIELNTLPEEQSLLMDEHLLKNSLINLISNAIKYSGENEVITLDCRLEEDHLLIDVIDRGMGIPKKEQNYMFTRFFRATNVTNIKGTGLGLTIVKRYIDLMKGEITFTSEEGVGSTFTLKIPANNTPKKQS